MVGSYINKDKNDGEGRPDEMEGNDVGPFVVPVPLARKESLTEVEMETGKITFSQPMNGIEIYNESNSNSLTYTINGIGVILEPGASDKAYYDSFTEVTIIGTDLDFTAVGLG